MSFEAKYHGVCEACGDDIEPGDEVAYRDHSLMHIDCADQDAEGFEATTSPVTIIDPPSRGRPTADEVKHPGNPPQTFFE